MAPVMAELASRPAPAQQLRAAGLRATAVRLAVMGALEQHPHAQTGTVINYVRANLGTVSAQAVYNVLSTLAEAGLLRRIEPAGSAALYELRAGDNHHHVVCRRCGAVADVDCAVGRRPCLTPSDLHGYLLDEAEVTYWGICPDCQASTGLAAGRRAQGQPTASQGTASGRPAVSGGAAGHGRGRPSGPGEAAGRGKQRPQPGQEAPVALPRNELQADRTAQPHSRRSQHGH